MRRLLGDAGLFGVLIINGFCVSLPSTLVPVLGRRPSDAGNRGKGKGKKEARLKSERKKNVKSEEQYNN